MGGRAIAAAVLLVLLAAGCSASGGDEASEEAGPASAAAPQAAGDEAAGGVAAGEAAGVAGGGEGAGAPGQEADGGSASAGAGGETPPLPDAPFAPEDRIIKQGTVTLAVEEGGFDRAYARVVEAARRYGGTVLSSTTRTDDEGGATYGSVTLRVPAESYEDLLLGVGEIGEIRSREITAEDVSEEFVDLQSRQRNLEAQERFYLGLLEEAQGVSDAIAVQQQLSTITEQLEQVKGRLAFLDERTRFSTLTVELFEPGAPVAPADEPADEPSLARAWQTAQDAFVNVVGILLVVLVALTPVVVPLALIGAVVWQVARRRRRDRPAPARGPDAGAPPPPPDREPSLTG